MYCVQPKLLVIIVNTNFLCDTISRYKKGSEEMLDVEIKKFIIEKSLHVLTLDGSGIEYQEYKIFKNFKLSRKVTRNGKIRASQFFNDNI